MTPLVNQHLSMIRAESNGRSDDWIMREHKRRLTAWLKDLHLPDGETVEEQTIKRLAVGPSTQVTLWQGYDITALDEKTGENTIYFGVIEDIWEVHYGSNI